MVTYLHRVKGPGSVMDMTDTAIKKLRSSNVDFGWCDVEM